MAIIEPILDRAGPAAASGRPARRRAAADRQPLPNNAPRNTYRTADGHWVAVSTSAQSRRRTGDAPGRAPGPDRRAVVRRRRRPRRARRRTRRGRRRTGSPGAPGRGRGRVREGRGGDRADPRRTGRDGGPAVPGAGHDHRGRDPELGPLRMQNVLFRLSETPGAIRWAGRPHGADTDEILAELGLGSADRGRARCGDGGGAVSAPGGSALDLAVRARGPAGGGPQGARLGRGRGDRRPGGRGRAGAQGVRAVGHRGAPRTPSRRTRWRCRSMSGSTARTNVRERWRGLPGLSGMRLPKITHAASVQNHVDSGPGCCRCIRCWMGRWRSSTRTRSPGRITPYGGSPWARRTSGRIWGCGTTPAWTGRAAVW